MCSAVIHNHETRGILLTTALLPDVPLPSDHKERNADGIADEHEFALEDTIDRLTSLWQQDHQQQLAELPQLPKVAPTLAILPTSDEGNGIGSDGSSAGANGSVAVAGAARIVDPCPQQPGSRLRDARPAEPNTNTPVLPR